MRSPRFVAFFGSAAVLVGLASADGAETDTAEERAACESARAAVEILKSGDFDARWKTLDEAEDWLDDVPDPDDEEGRGCRSAVAADLLRIVRVERDDRIVCRILDADLDQSSPLLRDYIPEALRHWSPNVRRRALDALGEAPDLTLVPAIEDVWRNETRPWVRVPALRALRRADGARFLETFIRATRDEDPMIARAAIEAVGAVGGPRAVEALAGLASGPDPDRSSLALELLIGIDPSDDADDALVRVGARARSDAAVEIVDALAGRGSGAVSMLRSLERARGLDAGDEAIARAEAAIVRLEQPADFETITVTTSCHGGAGGGRPVPLIRWDDDVQAPATVVARHQETTDTARCWEAPGLALTSRPRDRVPRGAPLTTIDLFEWKGELWYAVAHEAATCWIPASELRAELGPPDGAERKDPASPVAAEVDVVSDELAGEAARRLVRLGLATIGDEDDRVAMLRVAPDPARVEEVLALVGIRALADGRVARAIDTWLTANAGRWISDPEIGPAVLAARPDSRDPDPPDDD